ncbi:hypothetical protein [Bacillus chungangensis]|uniref:Uncharacterized protein n=1 Tax=Bacillus chungangensis TaxID=587633 RepID=A0ABT9WUH8_9BACI|nr:hypothetical protein [Bacillus chungangensis]MDQ0176950.1 hypothetical protein [Bacillus chungangensis]
MNTKVSRFGSNVPLTKEELENLYKSVVNSDPELFGHDSGGSYVIEIPATYRSYDNKVVKEAADVLVAYIMKRILKKITDNVFANWTFTKLFGWAKNFPKKTYVGSWVSSA